MKSKSLAQKFNEKLSRLGISYYVPRIDFLDCCVYECNDTSVFLSEKQLNPKHYHKWNNNAGGVDGIIKFNALSCKDVIADETQSVEIGTRVVKFAPLEKISESDDENDDDSIIDDDELPYASVSIDHDMQILFSRILDQDIPQAFSHLPTIIRGEII
jgi:hypothetical protein